MCLFNHAACFSIISRFFIYLVVLHAACYLFYDLCVMCVHVHVQYTAYIQITNISLSLSLQLIHWIWDGFCLLLSTISKILLAFPWIIWIESILLASIYNHWDQWKFAAIRTSMQSLSSWWSCVLICLQDEWYVLVLYSKIRSCSCL